MTAPFFCSTNSGSLFLCTRERVTSSFCSRHHGTTTSFMKALSLSKSTPRNSHGNGLCARLVASTTGEPSRDYRAQGGRRSQLAVSLALYGAVDSIERYDSNVCRRRQVKGAHQSESSQLRAGANVSLG